MYSNIGNKIKVLAQVIALIGIIGSVISGISLIAQGQEDYFDNSGLMTLIGIATLIGGSLLSWVSSFILYGFGELIEKTVEIAKNTAAGGSPITSATNTENDEKMKTLISWKENGLISAEEFEIKKKALLGGQ